MNDANDLKVLIESHVPLIVLETHEEQRAFDVIEKLAVRHEWPLFGWSVADGICRRILRQERVADTTDPEKAMRHLESTPQNGVYVLLDFHPYLTNPMIVRLVRQIAQTYHKTARTLIFVSPRLELPAELQRLAARFALAVPDREAIQALVREEVDLWTRLNGDRVKAERAAYDALVQHVVGSSLEDARRLVRLAIRDDGAITHTDIDKVLRAKRQLLGTNELLEFEFDTGKFADIGGLKNLKRWLTVREAAFRAEPAAGLEPPRGILLLGVQGGGKSLAAKAVAGAWRLPLLRMDFGALYNKYHGETERNLREALKAAEAMAPCVLWFDEVEKGLAPDNSDDGVSRRLLGTLLTWMAERNSKVFLVATANDVQALPPELLRKGRFDELFFIDFPDAAARREIFEIHLKRRDREPAQFDLQKMAQVTDGFSGAEIEQAIVSALYQAHAAGGKLSTDHILSEIEQTKPLSVVMVERVAALRAWAAGRTVIAN